jgi:ethanolamine utilization protein EutP (predicted NTPase)
MATEITSEFGQRSLLMFKFKLNLTSLGSGLRKCASTLVGILGKIVSFCWFFFLPMAFSLISWAIADMTGNYLGQALSFMGGFFYYMISMNPFMGKSNPWAPLVLYLVLATSNTLYFERLVDKVIFTENRVIGIASLELYNPMLSKKIRTVDKDQEAKIDVYGKTADGQTAKVTLVANLTLGLDEKSLMIIKTRNDWETFANLQVKSDFTKSTIEYLAKTKAASISDIEASKAVMKDVDAEKIHNLGFAWDGSIEATVVTTK